MIIKLTIWNSKSSQVKNCTEIMFTFERLVEWWEQPLWRSLSLHISSQALPIVWRLGLGSVRRVQDGIYPCWPWPVARVGPKLGTYGRKSKRTSFCLRWTIFLNTRSSPSFDRVLKQKYFFFKQNLHSGWTPTKIFIAVDCLTHSLAHPLLILY
jgi:hypothetical protein